MTIRELEEHLKGYDKNMSCAWVLWLPGDVRKVADLEGIELSNEKVSEILDDIHSHQGGGGITWESIRYAVQDYDRVRRE